VSSKNPIKRIFDLYTSDLSFTEIERLIKRESAEVYEFFKNDIPKSSTSRNKVVRALIFLRSLFNAFLLKLSPARRIIYLLTLLIFIIGYLNNMGSYVIVSFVILNFLLAFELADKLLTKSELQVARKIQTDLMPKIPPKINNFEVSAYYESAKEVGGDYFDIFKSESGDKTYLIVGDISGKGMAAALYMVRVQAILHSLISNFSNLRDIIISLKDNFDKKLLPEYFLTLAAASIDDKGTITLCRAGHPPIIHYKSSTDTFDEINPKGIGIGLKDNGAFAKILETVELKPEPNDILFFYTDGITECMNESRQQLGLNPVKNVLKKYAGSPPEIIQKEIIKEIENFRGENIHSDDITMIILKAV